MIEKYKDYFYSYTRPYLEKVQEPGLVRIKIFHTFKVVDHATELCQYIPKELRKSTQLAALFHDLGRFPQLLKYNTFSDSISYNHARLSLRALKETQILSGLTKEEQYIINTAVLMHNRYMLPSSLPQYMRKVCYAVRDADKFDILRVMIENFHQVKPNSDQIFLNVKNEPYYTPKILQDLLTGRTAHYSDMVYVNDFRLLLGTWLHEINYSHTKRCIKEMGYYDIITEGLPNNPDMDKAKEKIQSLLKGIA